MIFALPIAGPILGKIMSLNPGQRRVRVDSMLIEKGDDAQYEVIVSWTYDADHVGWSANFWHVLVPDMDMSRANVVTSTIEALLVCDEETINAVKCPSVEACWLTSRQEHVE